jgi:hypothetical protein
MAKRTNYGSELAAIFIGDVVRNRLDEYDTDLRLATKYAQHSNLFIVRGWLPNKDERFLRTYFDNMVNLVKQSDFLKHIIFVGGEKLLEDKYCQDVISELIGGYGKKIHLATMPVGKDRQYIFI